MSTRHALRRLRRLPRPAPRVLAAPLVPRPGEVVRAAGLELEHGGRDRLEEPAVVRDEDDRRVDRLELALEPLEALDVEVVRRLVEEEQVGIARERARERGARQLAAGERAERPVEVVVGEAEAAQRPRRRDRARPSRPRARAAPAPRSSGAASRRRGRRRPSPARAAAAPPRPRAGRERPRARTRAASGRLERRALVVERDRACPSANASSPPWIDVSPDDRAQQRRLAGAVRPGEREAVPALDRERDAVEERIAGELLAQLRCDEDGHGR